MAENYNVLPPHIKRATPTDQDALAIIECLTCTFGENYSRPFMYDKNYLKEKIKNSDLIVLMAQTENGDVAGIASLMKHDFFYNSYELGMYAVKSRYRKNNYGKSVMKQAVNHLHTLRNTAHYTHCVTTEPIAQNHVEHFGFIGTGFLFSIQDNKKLTYNQRIQSEKRSLCVATMKSLENSRDTLSLYVPEALADVTHDIFRRLHVTYTISKEGEPLGEESILQHHCDCHHSTLYIKIFAVGKDLSLCLDNLTTKYRHLFNTTTVFLNMSTKKAIEGFYVLQKMNFMFSGFKPLYEDGSYMILFDGGNIKTDFYELDLNETMKDILKGVLSVGQ